MGYGSPRDVKPQWLKIDITESTVNTFREEALTIPTSKLVPRAGFVQVMEILEVKFWDNHVGGAAGHAVRIQLSTMASSEMNDGKSPATFFEYNLRFSAAKATNTTTPLIYPRVINLEDQRGHGELVVGDRLYIGIQGVAAAAVLNVKLSLRYRWTNIRRAEFMGVMIQHGTVY